MSYSDLFPYFWKTTLIENINIRQPFLFNHNKLFVIFIFLNSFPLVFLLSFILKMV